MLSSSVFGSVARDEAAPDSDVDVAVRLDNGFSQGGLDYFWELEQLRERLSRLLGCKVDVVAEPVRKERLTTRNPFFRYTEGMNVVDFEENRLVYDAVEHPVMRSQREGK